jgi:hypothetical protein
VVVLPVPGPPLMIVKPSSPGERRGQLLPVGTAVEALGIGGKERFELSSQGVAGKRRAVPRAPAQVLRQPLFVGEIAVEVDTPVAIEQQRQGRGRWRGRLLTRLLARDHAAGEQTAA